MGGRMRAGDKLVCSAIPRALSLNEPQAVLDVEVSCRVIRSRDRAVTMWAFLGQAMLYWEA